MFVVIEGGEASGKSTQVALLAARLRQEGHRVVETFEPGATPLGASIRATVLHGSEPLDPLAEALLMAADRAQHLADVVRPALADGAWVVCDRHVPSSLVYQGVGRGLGVDAVAAINARVAADTQPDLVVVVDVTEATAASRRNAATDRMESAGDAFHAVVRDAYRTLAASHGWVVVDGNASREVVAQRLWDAVASRVP